MVVVNADVEIQRQFNSAMAAFLNILSEGTGLLLRVGWADGIEFLGAH